MCQSIGNGQQGDSVGGNNIRALQMEAIAALLTNSHRMWRRRGGFPNRNRICTSASSLSTINDSLDSRLSSASTESRETLETECKQTREWAAKPLESITAASTEEEESCHKP
jgi:hypothetical protein